MEKVRGGVFDVNGVPINRGDVVTFLDVHGTCNACYGYPYTNTHYPYTKYTSLFVGESRRRAVWRFRVGSGRRCRTNCAEAHRRG